VKRHAKNVDNSVDNSGKSYIKPPSLITQARDNWYERFEEVKGYPYPRSYDKDSGIWKWFFKQYHSLAWALGFTDFYLKWDNPFVKQCGYSLEGFVKVLPTILEQKVHKKDWVKKYEDKYLESSSSIIRKILSGADEKKK